MEWGRILYAGELSLISMTVLRLFNCTLLSLDCEYLHAYGFFYGPFAVPEIKFTYLLTYLLTYRVGV